MTNHPDLFTALAAPFGDGEVKTFSKGGKTLSYVTTRTIMNRLDDVLGPENWWDVPTPVADGTWTCRLTILLPDGRTLTKVGVGGNAGMADEGDDDKSGESDAFKRAAVKFGVGRHLYRDGVPAFVRAALAPTPHSGQSPATPRRKERHEWQTAQPPSGTKAPAVGNPGHTPRSGRSLFGWCKDQEQRCGVGLLKYLNAWAKLQEFPGRMVDWDAEQVARAHAEALRKLRAIEDGSQEVMEEVLTS